MPKDQPDIDQWISERVDRIEVMTDAALLSAAEEKGSALDDDEIDVVLAHFIRRRLACDSKGGDETVGFA
jgi:hypothetical protein